MICKRCNKDRKECDFRIFKGYRVKVCKYCRNKREKDKRRLNTKEQKEKISIKRKDIYKKNPEYYRWAVSNSTYKKLGISITKEEYDILFLSQDKRCAICNRSQSEFERRLSLDHCHKTKKIRGFLCKDCNIGIGCFKENPDLFISAMAYLKKNAI